MDVLNKELSKELSLNINFDGSKIVFVQKYDGKQLDQELRIGVEIDLLVDSLAAKIIEKHPKLVWINGVVPFIKSVFKLIAK